MPTMFSERDLEVFDRLRRAFDPDGLANPGKVAADPAALRRGAGAVPRAPARAARACRAALSARVDRGGVRAPRRGGQGRDVGCGSARSLVTDGLDRGARARGGRPHLHRRGGDPALVAPGRARARGSEAVARPARGSDGRGLPRRPAVRAAPHRYGTPRDLVLGVTLVLGDGTVASSGGKVVKNVAGYDLGKLVCGSRRTPRADRARRAPAAPAARAAGTLVVETRRHAPRRCARSSARSCSRARSTCSIRAASRCSSRARRPPSRRSSSRRGRSSAGRGAEGSVWDEARERQAALAGSRAVRAGRAAQRALDAPGGGRAARRGHRVRPARVGGVPPATARRLHEALRARFDPAGVLG